MSTPCAVFRTFAFVLTALLTCATGCGAAYAAPGPEPWIPNYASWMNDMRGEIGDRSLMTLPMPATHDTLTYDIPSIGAEKAPDLPADPVADIRNSLGGVCDVFPLDELGLCDLVFGVVDQFVIAISYRWSKTQQFSVRQQLDDGVRGLDFRICIDAQKRMRGCHGLFTNGEASQYFNEVKQFLEQNPNEFIILLVRAVEWGEEDVQPMVNLMQQTFGELLITDPVAYARPLNELWTRPGRIFAISTGGGLDDKANFIHTEGDTLQSPYTATTDGALLESLVLASVNGRATDSTESSEFSFSDGEYFSFAEKQVKSALAAADSSANLRFSALDADTLLIENLPPFDPEAAEPGALATVACLEGITDFTAVTAVSADLENISDTSPSCLERDLDGPFNEVMFWQLPNGKLYKLQVTDFSIAEGAPGTYTVGGTFRLQEIWVPRMLSSQTQMTVDAPMLQNMGITWLIDRMWDTWVNGPIEAICDGLEAVDTFDCWRETKTAVADQLGIRFFYFEPWGVLDYEPVKDGEGTPIVRGLWYRSLESGVAPLFQTAEVDPVFREKVNLISVDNYKSAYVYGSRNGFVDAVLALAGDGKPPLYVGVRNQVRFSETNSPAINLLPAGLRATLLDDDLPPYNPVLPNRQLPPISEPGQFGATFAGMDIMMPPRASGPLVGWTEVTVERDFRGLFHFSDGVTRLQQLSGFGEPLPFDHFFPLDFPDAVGAPSMAIHEGRFYVAYAVQAPGSLHPLMMLRSAPLPENWPELVLSNFDQEVILSQIELPFTARLGAILPFPGFAICDAIEITLPRPSLVSMPPYLAVAWAAPGDSLEPEGEPTADDEACLERYVTGRPSLGLLDVSSGTPVVSSIVSLYEAAGVPAGSVVPSEYSPIAARVGGRLYVGSDCAQGGLLDCLKLFEVDESNVTLLAAGAGAACFPSFPSTSLFDFEGQLMLAGDGTAWPVSIDRVNERFSCPFGSGRGVSSARFFDDEEPKRLHFATAVLPSVSTFTVNKLFSDGNPGSATIGLGCAETPPTDSIITISDQASAASPALFEVSGFYDSYGATGTTCTATETPIVGYTADESNCVDVFVPADGAAHCQIVNTQKPVIIRAFKSYEEGDGPPASFSASCEQGSLKVIKDTASPGSPAEFELSGFPWDGTDCSVVEQVPPNGFYPVASTCDALSVLPSDEATECEIINAVTEARFLVSKLYSDGNQDEVEVTLSCNNGLPLQQSFTISAGGPVNFVITRFTEGAMHCEVTETGAAEGYTAAYDNGASVSATNCSYSQVLSGQYGCGIVNTANPATFTVSMAWQIVGEASFDAPEEVPVTILCDRPIMEQDSFAPSAPGGDWAVTRPLRDGESMTVTVDVETGPATCHATQALGLSAIESSDDCGERELSAGGESSCTISNTLFFEGVPALSPSALAVMALLLLGGGLYGFRRMSGA